MLTGLFRVLLILVGFLFVQRIFGSWLNRSGDTRKTTPRREAPSEDLAGGQPIEEAEYEELD